MTTIIGFLNSYISGSGGDIRFLEILSRLKKFRKVIVTPHIGMKFCQGYKLDVEYFLTSQEREINVLSLAYILRIVKAIGFNPRLKKNDILYSSSDFLPDVFPAFLLKKRQSKVKWMAIFHLITPNPFFGPEQYYLKKKKIKMPTLDSLLNKLNQLLSILLIRNATDLVLVINDEIKNYLKNWGIAEEKILVVSNGVDLDKIKKTKSYPKKIYDLSFIGRFHPQKGIFDLIEAMRLIVKQKNDCRLALIGSGEKSFEREVDKVIDSYGLAKNIDRLGFIGGEEKYALVKSSKVFLFPSFYESFGIVAAEAMACGRPVVAYDLPVYGKIFGEGMIKVPIGEAKLLAQETLKLLGDSRSRKILTRKATKFMEKYSWEKITQRELEIIKSLKER